MGWRVGWSGGARVGGWGGGGVGGPVEQYTFRY